MSPQSSLLSWRLRRPGTGATVIRTVMRTVGLALVAALAVAPSPGAAAAPARVGAAKTAALSVTAGPALTPSFDPAIVDYTSVCSAALPVSVAVSAPAGTTVAVDGNLPQSGSFTVAVTRDVGQSFSFVALKGTASTTYHVRCLPADFPPISVQRTGATQAGSYLVSPFITTSGQPPAPPISDQYVAIVDTHGVPVWWKRVTDLVPAGFPATDFDLLANGDLAFTYGGQGGGPISNGGAVEIDLAGHVVRALNTVGVPEDGHELQLLPDGNYLLDAYPIRTNVDLSAIGGSTTATMEDAEIQEVTPSGALVWSWDASAHIPATEMDSSLWPQLAASSQADLYHFNSASVDPANGNIVLSLRHANAIYEFNPKTGAIVWKVGGTPRPESLTMAGDALGGPVGQHFARLTAGGMLSLFDNGSQGPPTGRAPWALRYRLNTAARTATFVDQVTDPAATTSGCCGSATKLTGGDWVISWGLNDRVTETTAAGVPVLTMTFGGDLTTYRAIPVSAKTLTPDTLRAAMDAQHPVPTVSVGSVDLNSGNVGPARFALFPVTLSVPASVPVTVQFGVVPFGAPGAIASSTGTVTFPAGSTTQYAWTQVSPAPAGNPAEAFAVGLFNPTAGYQIGGGGGGLVLPQDNSPVPELAVGDAMIWNTRSGPDPLVLVPMTLSRPAATTVTAIVTIGNGSAIAGRDYVAAPIQAVTFAPGQIEQSVFIAAVPNALPGLTSTMSVTASAATGGVVVVRPVGTVVLGNG